MLIGTNFKTDPDRLAEDLRILEGASFDSVRLGAVGLKRQEQGYSFDRMLHLLEPLRQRRIPACLPLDLRPFTNPDCTPAVFDDPAMSLTDQQGNRIFQQTFRNFNFNHPGLRQTWAHYINAFIMAGCPTPDVLVNFCNELHYSARGSIVARSALPGEVYNDDNEKIHLGYRRLRPYHKPEQGFVGAYSDQFHLTDYSQFTIAEFRSWLKNKYGTTEKLDTAWGEKGLDFDSVDPPRDLPFADGYKQTAWIDWLSFRFCDYLNLFAWVRKTIRGRARLTHNSIASRYLLPDPFSGVDLWRLSEHLDVCGIDYPDVFDLALLSTTGKPIHIIEASVGYHAQFMYREVILAAAGGANEIHLWHRNMDYVHQRKQVMQGVEAARPIVSRITGKPVHSQTAVLYAHHSLLSHVAQQIQQSKVTTKPGIVKSDYADQLQKLTHMISGGCQAYRQDDYLGAVLASWINLQQMGRRPWPIGQSMLNAEQLSQYQSLWLPDVVSLTDDDLQVISEFSGTVVSTGVLPGMCDEHNHLRDVEHNPLAQRMGVKGFKKQDRQAVLRGPGWQLQLSQYQTLIPSTDANVIATDDLGQPVALVRGKDLILGFEPSPSASFLTIDHLAREILDLSSHQAQHHKALWDWLENWCEQRIGQPEVRIESLQNTQGLWHNLFQTEQGYQLVIYDYANWQKTWQILQDPKMAQAIEGLTQPRCFELRDPQMQTLFDADARQLHVTVQLPKSVYVKEIQIIQNQQMKMISSEIMPSKDSASTIRMNLDNVQFVCLVDLIVDKVNA